jgi:hypothetical protein
MIENGTPCSSSSIKELTLRLAHIPHNKLYSLGRIFFLLRVQPNNAIECAREYPSTLKRNTNKVFVYSLEDARSAVRKVAWMTFFSEGSKS